MAFLGAMQLSKLGVPVVRQFQDRLREEGQSPAMVKRVTVSLGGILTDAQERGTSAGNAVRECRGGGPKGASGNQNGDRRPGYGSVWAFRHQRRSARFLGLLRVVTAPF